MDTLSSLYEQMHRPDSVWRKDLVTEDRVYFYQSKMHPTPQDVRALANLTEERNNALNNKLQSRPDLVSRKIYMMVGKKEDTALPEINGNQLTVRRASKDQNWSFHTQNLRRISHVSSVAKADFVRLAEQVVSNVSQLPTVKVDTDFEKPETNGHASNNHSSNIISSNNMSSSYFPSDETEHSRINPLGRNSIFPKRIRQDSLRIPSKLDYSEPQTNDIAGIGGGETRTEMDDSENVTTLSRTTTLFGKYSSKNPVFRVAHMAARFNQAKKSAQNAGFANTDAELDMADNPVSETQNPVPPVKARRVSTSFKKLVMQFNIDPNKRNSRRGSQYPGSMKSVSLKPSAKEPNPVSHSAFVNNVNEHFGEQNQTEAMAQPHTPGQPPPDDIANDPGQEDPSFLTVNALRAFVTKEKLTPEDTQAKCQGWLEALPDRFSSLHVVMANIEPIRVRSKIEGITL